MVITCWRNLGSRPDKFETSAMFTMLIGMMSAAMAIATMATPSYPAKRSAIAKMMKPFQRVDA